MVFYFCLGQMLKWGSKLSFGFFFLFLHNSHLPQTPAMFFLSWIPALLSPTSSTCTCLLQLFANRSDSARTGCLSLGCYLPCQKSVVAHTLQSSLTTSIFDACVQTGAPNAPIMAGRLWFLLSPAINLLPVFKNTAESCLRRPSSRGSGARIALAMPNLFSLSTRLLFSCPASGPFRAGSRPYIPFKNVSAGREARKFSEGCARGSSGGGEGQGEGEGELGRVEGTGRVRGGGSKGSFPTTGLL